MSVNLRAVAANAARRNGIPVNLFYALINQESGWQAHVVSPAGARGPTQLMPGTARGLGVNPDDPVQNIEGGARYLAGLYHEFGNWKLALAAYNAGAGAVRKYGGVPPYAETQAYVRNILSKAGATGRGAVNALPPIVGRAVGGGIGSAPDLSGFAFQNLSHLAAGWDPSSVLSTLPPLLASGSAPSPALSGALPSKGSAQVVHLAEKYIGTPYLWGGATPKGFDCSGLLQYIWAQAGVKIPRTTYAQFQAGTPVAKNALRPGDAVFFRGSDARGGLPGHVGLYIGGGRFIEAPHTGASVRVSTLAGRSDYVGARRY